MSPDARDDDPTHALDDFVQRMRQPARPTPAPDLSDIGASLRADAPAAPTTRPQGPQGPRGGVLRSGQRWDMDDVDDVDAVPVVELPRQPVPDTSIPLVTLPTVDLQAEEVLAALSPEVALPVVDAPPAPPDSATLDAATRGTRDFAATQWDLERAAADTPVWQPDPVALQLRTQPNPRLLPRWQATAWTGAVRQVMESTTEFGHTAAGPTVETWPAQRLLLLWPPQGAQAPSRWPQQVLLLAVPPADAPLAALALLPEDATLWLQADAPDADWVLGAEIALHHLPALRPFQRDALRSFIDREREAVFTALNDGYRQPVPGAPAQRV